MTTSERNDGSKSGEFGEMLEQTNTFDDWLKNNFRVKATRQNYTQGALIFLKAIYGETEYKNWMQTGEGIDRYLKDKRIFLDDFKKMVRYMNSMKYSPATIHSTCSNVKTFFDEHGHEIEAKDWRIMKRALLPSNVVLTQDDILNKAQLESVIYHLTICGKAVALFLSSTGARVGESMKLKIADLKLDNDPPQVNIRPQYTKKGLGGRVVWMSYEARDAIKEWFKIKVTRLKKNKEPFPKDMVFGFTPANFSCMWHTALKKAGLEQRDPTTNFRIYHVHTLRKFFRTRMGLANVSDLVVHAWMGHKAYLNTYDKLGKEEMANLYRDHMDAVSIYTISGDVTAFREQLDSLTNQVETQKKDKKLVEELLTKYDIPDDIPMNERLISLITKIQQKPEAPATPPQTEPVTPSKPVSKPPEIHVETKKELVKEDSKLIWCPYKEDWINPIKCETCKALRFKVYADCKRRRILNPNDSLFDPDKPRPLGQ